MTAHLRANVLLVVLTLLLCSVVYPLVLLGVGQLAFSEQANGSLVDRDGKPVDRDRKPVGSRLIAQNFTADHYFWPRPSFVSYNAAASGASNWAANNPKLRFRVARQLGPIVKYIDGKLVGGDIEKWFAEKDRLAGWAADNPTLAAEWVKTDDTTKKLVTDYAKANPDVLLQWRKDNPNGDLPNVEESPDAVAVQFLASFAAKHPRAFPGTEDVPAADGKTEKRLKPVTTGADLQGVFFDAWLQDHRTVVLEQVPADMVMASGSGLDPHITLRNARYQLGRVVAARAPTEADRQRIKQQIEALLLQAEFKPLAGLAGGDSLVNVLEINLHLDHDLPIRPAK
jgi:potassium-transporting ATPase KdpC subunit